MSEDKKTTSKWTRSKRVLVMVAVVAAVVAIPQFVYLSVQVHAANQAFSTFGQALEARDYQGAYNLTSPEFRSATSEATFVSQQELLCAGLGGIQKITEGSFETQKRSDGWSSDISARFMCKQGEKQVDVVL